MKKISLFVLAFALCLGLSACGGNTSASSAASEASGSGSEAASSAASEAPAASESAASAASESAEASAASGSAAASESAEASGSAASAVSDITMEAVAAANTPEALQANFDNVLMTTKNSTGYEHIIFAAKDFTFSSESSDGEVGDEMLNDGKDVWGVSELDGEEVLFNVFYAMDDEEARYATPRIAAPKDFSTIDVATTADETITNITDNGDGTLTISCDASPLEYEILKKEYGDDIPEIFQDAKFTEEYVVDKETLIIKQQTEHLIKDGAEQEAIVCTVEYNVAQPENAAKIIERRDKCIAEDAGATRTITVVYDAGTPQEETFTKETTKGAGYWIIQRLGYETAYGDPDKKTELDSESETDVTAYFFAGE